VIIHLWSLRDHDSNDLFPSDMQDTAIFSSYGFKARISILSIYLDYSKKIESNKTDLIDM
jgi:hypothetical protein